MAIIDTLESIGLFDGLSTPFLEELSDLSRAIHYKQGAIIFKEGDEAKELYLLKDGEVILEMDVRPIPDRPGIPTAVEVIRKGGAFGWSALVEPYRYTLSARCVTRCSTLELNSVLLRKHMADNTGLGFELMKRVAKIISLRLTDTRLRLTSGLGIALLGMEQRGSK